MKTKETSNLQPAFDREAALQWWNIQHSSAKIYLEDKHFGFRTVESLTGREIEMIWRKETAHIDPSDIEAAYKMQVTNQKQFKQFDESLFKAYIDKFSKDDKFKAFNILNEEFAYYSHEQMELIQKQHDKQVEFLQDKILELSK